MRCTIKSPSRGDATATDNKATAVGRQRMFPRVNNQASRYKLLTTVKKYTLQKVFKTLDKASTP